MTTRRQRAPWTAGRRCPSVRRGDVGLVHGPVAAQTLSGRGDLDPADDTFGLGLARAGRGAHLVRCLHDCPCARDARPAARCDAPITDIGKSEWYLVPTAIVLLVLATLDWRSRPPRVRAQLAFLFSQAGYAFAAVAISGILVNIIKLFIGRGRAGAV